jgi:hypothetical protein
MTGIGLIAGLVLAARAEQRTAERPG